ncbi:MAG TPA: tripartite tricarboxylate transporter substrate binding protein, partial [Xanthobacteraceae bacterium]|nr:tripartite tricarboxylate transporter substrate binding protein [Xanthobacteraceae bacterium]
PLADFSFISIMATTATTLVVHPSIPVNSVAEFVAYAKKEPVAYAHGGNGTPGHLAMEYFRLLAGFKTLPVPYRGNPQLVADLVAGQIKFGFVGSSGVAQHIRAGRLKGLAISTRERSPLAPELPTIAESGYPEFEFDTYYVLAAPAGIPGRAAALLEREVLQVLASPDLREKFRAQDTVIAPTSGAEASARIKSDFQKWAKVVKAAGMHVD